MTDFIWGHLGNVSNKNAKDSDSDDDTNDETAVYRNQNEIWFNCGVNAKNIDSLIKLVYEIVHDEKLSAYRENNNLEIIIHIDSSGGYVSSAFKFIDFMQCLKKKGVKFKSIINGKACSSATLIAIVADSRQITQHSYAMIHELSSGVYGKITEIRSYQKHLDMCHKHIIETYITHNPALTVETIEAIMTSERWFSAQEYKTMGFVNDII